MERDEPHPLHVGLFCSVTHLEPVPSGLPGGSCLETLLIAWVAPGKLHRGDYVSSVIWRNMIGVLFFFFSSQYPETEGFMFSVFEVD